MEIRRIRALVIAMFVTNLSNAAIHRASQHKTVMHKMIADSNTWAKAPDSLHDEITAIQKRLMEVNASIDNIVKFIETGGFSETLASRLNTLEATKASYTQKASEVRLAAQCIEEKAHSRHGSSFLGEGYRSVASVK